MQVNGIMLGCRCEVVLHETNLQPPAGGQLVITVPAHRVSSQCLVVIYRLCIFMLAELLRASLP